MLFRRILSRVFALGIFAVTDFTGDEVIHPFTVRHRSIPPSVRP